MNATRKVARWVGALFLISNATFLVGAVVLIDPVLGSADPLGAVAAARGTVVLGVLLELINALAYLGIAVLVYPLLRPRFESMALAYVGIRILEFVTQILAGFGPLTMVLWSADWPAAVASAGSGMQGLAGLLVAERAAAYQLLGIPFSAGALLLYSMLYRIRLVPRFISVWGLLGAAAVIATTILDMFGASAGSLGAIMLLNELFLGAWLIVRGFDAPQAVTEPAR